MFEGTIHPKDLVPVVGDGGVSDLNVAQGRFIPALVVDCSNNDSLRQLIEMHKETPPGDVVMAWGRRRFSSKSVYLDMYFKKPMELHVVFEFNVEKQGALVQWIQKARGVYLQIEVESRRFSDNFGAPMILVEVPAGATFPKWPEIFRKTLTKKYKANGLTNKQTTEAVAEHLKRIEEFCFKRSVNVG